MFLRFAHGVSCGSGSFIVFARSVLSCRQTRKDKEEFLCLWDFKAQKGTQGKGIHKSSGPAVLRASFSGPIRPVFGPFLHTLAVCSGPGLPDCRPGSLGPRMAVSLSLKHQPSLLEQSGTEMAGFQEDAKGFLVTTWDGVGPGSGSEVRSCLSVRGPLIKPSSLSR